MIQSSGETDTESHVVSTFQPTVFEKRWRNRARTTHLELSLLGELARSMDRRRIVELGAGVGRLSGFLSSTSSEYIGVDLSAEMIAATRDRLGPREGRLFVHADMRHLPFRSSAITAAFVVRVYNHLPDPRAALCESARVLLPGSRLVLSTLARPSLLTLEMDVTAVLANAPQYRRLTFARDRLVRYSRGTKSVLVPSQTELDATLRESGLGVEKEVGTGLEDQRWLRRVGLPLDVLLRIGQRWPRSWWFSHRWLLARTSASEQPPLPQFEELLACPSCRTPLGELERSSNWTVRCPSCDFVLRCRDSIIEAVV